MEPGHFRPRFKSQLGYLLSLKLDKDSSIEPQFLIVKQLGKDYIKVEFGEVSCSNSSSLFSTWLPVAPPGMWGASNPHLKHRGEFAPWRALSPQA